jgi:plasmid stabilization system protein ParE
MEVYVTPRAEQDFDGVFEYIKNRWGLGTARQFVAKTDE